MVTGTDEAKGEVREGRVLSRVLRVTNRGWQYEGDQRHADFVIKALKLEDAKETKTPGEEQKP